MNALKKTVAFALLAATATVGAVANSGEAKADYYKQLYSYHTEYGHIKFYNTSNNWPVVKKIRYNHKWHRCSFWYDRYSCEPSHTKSYGGGWNGGGHSKSYGGGSYGGGYSSGY